MDPFNEVNNDVDNFNINVDNLIEVHTPRSVRVPVGGGLVPLPAEQTELTLVHCPDTFGSASAPSYSGPPGPGGAGDEETVTQVVQRQSVQLATEITSAAASAVGPLAVTGAGAAAGAAAGGALAAEAARQACHSIPLVGSIVSPVVEAMAGTNGATIGAICGAAAAQSMPPMADVVCSISESDLAKAVKRSCSRRSQRSNATNNSTQNDDLRHHDLIFSSLIMLVRNRTSMTTLIRPGMLLSRLLVHHGTL